MHRGSFLCRPVRPVGTLDLGLAPSSPLFLIDLAFLLTRCGSQFGAPRIWPRIGAHISPVSRCAHICRARLGSSLQAGMNKHAAAARVRPTPLSPVVCCSTLLATHHTRRASERYCISCGLEVCARCTRCVVERAQRSATRASHSPEGLTCVQDTHTERERERERDRRERRKW